MKSFININSVLNKKPQNPYLKIFLICLFLAFIIFLPFLIFDRGMFIYYGDYNTQQIPFYVLAGDAVKSGNFGWNWSVDLGANFIGSFSFYLLGSPFFWLISLFPSWLIPYLMAPMLMLKFALAGLTSFAYIKRLTKTTEGAMLGAVMYAFCGFNIYNIFFNHFHEAIIVFPLLLLSMNELIYNKRRGVFALSVALCAVTNYFFFFGQVVFVIIYYFVKLFYKSYKFNSKEFLFLFFEAVLGVGLACVLLLPSILAIMGNPRTSEMLTGYDMVLFNKVQRYGLILQNLFFMPDPPANPVFFMGADSKWASVSAFLPLIGLTGVITFFRERKRHWIKTLLIICLTMSLIPILNSAFSAFNWNYYARWFYMPILFMCIISVVSLEDYKDKFKPAIFLSLTVIIGYLAIIFLPTMIDDELKFFELINQPLLAFLYVLLAVVFLYLTYLLVTKFKNDKIFFKTAFIFTIIGILTMSSTVMIIGRARGESYQEIQDVLTAKEDFDFVKTDTSFYRIDEFEAHRNTTSENGPMVWKMHTIQTFHSVVPPSIMEFYEAIGQERNVASRPTIDSHGLRGLTSVKYMLYNDDIEDVKTIPGFNFLSHNGNYNVYKNDYFIPMGFTYDYYVDETTFYETLKSTRDLLMLNGIYLEDNDALKYKHLLEPIPSELLPNQNDDYYPNACKQRAKTSGSFLITKDGFESNITLPKDNLVFFSVPYDKGFSATVNGLPVEIIKANVGFMAVPASNGLNDIVFTYKTPGLNLGFIITLISAIILIGYLYLSYQFRKKQNQII